MKFGLKLGAVALWLTLFLPSYADQRTSIPGSINWDIVTLITVPVELKSFWEPIIAWQKGLYEGPGPNDRSLKAISAYCVRYSKQHRDPSQIKFMILDLSQHPSEFRAITYGQVVVRLDRKKTCALLDSYSSRGTSAEKVAANDFIADMEEFDEDVGKNNH